MVKAISILGCTGSIGRQTAAVAEYTGIRVAALTANRQIDRLEEQTRRMFSILEQAPEKEEKIDRFLIIFVSIEPLKISVIELNHLVSHNIF